MPCRVCRSKEVLTGVCTSCLKGIVSSSNREKGKFLRQNQSSEGRFAKRHRNLILLLSTTVGIATVPISFLSTFELTLVQRLIVSLDVGVIFLLFTTWLTILTLVGLENPAHFIGIIFLPGLPMLVSPTAIMTVPLGTILVAIIMGEGKELKGSGYLLIIAYACLAVAIALTQTYFVGR